MNLRASKIQSLLALLFLSFTSFAQNEKVSNSKLVLTNETEVKGRIEGKFDVETYDEILFILILEKSQFISQLKFKLLG